MTCIREEEEKPLVGAHKHLLEAHKHLLGAHNHLLHYITLHKIIFRVPKITKDR